MNKGDNFLIIFMILGVIMLFILSFMLLGEV